MIQKQTIRTKKIVITGLLGALSYILVMINFPVLPTFSFLKLDFSDFPVLIGAFVAGPLAGVAVAFIRSLLHFMTTGGDLVNFIGDFTQFLTSVTFVLPVYVFVRKKYSTKQLLKGLLSGIIAMTVILSLANYFIILPIYLHVLNYQFGVSVSKIVLYGIIPFNLIKGASLSLLFMLVQSRLVALVEKNRLQFYQK